MMDDRVVRGDLAFGQEGRDYSPEQLRELYRTAIGLLRTSEHHVDMYRKYAERVEWECAELRAEVRKKQMLLDQALTAVAKRGDA